MCNEKLWVSKSTDNIFKDNKIKLKEHTNMHIHVKKIPGRGSWAEAYDFYFCNTSCPHLNLHKLKKKLVFGKLACLLYFKGAPMSPRGRN